MKSWLKRHPALPLVMIMVLLLRLVPEIDLAVSGWFYRDEMGFIYDHHPLVQLSYRLFAKLHFPLLFVLTWLLFASWYWRRDAERGLRRRLWFLLLVLVLGPGLLVSALKDNAGRARPASVVQFGGEQDFTAAFEPAQACDRNCSFVSGHAAMGFWFIALAWLFRDRRWLWIGIVIGGLVGMGRIMQGAHFLSDVVFSFWVVYGCCILLSGWLLGSGSIEKTKQRNLD